MNLTQTEQTALLWIAGVLFSGFCVTAWYVVRQLFARLTKIESDVHDVQLSVARLEAKQ